MSSNHRWYTSWFYLRNDDGGFPPYTGQIVEDCPEKWGYGVPKEDQPKLQPLLEELEGCGAAALWRLWSWWPSIVGGCCR